MSYTNHSIEEPKLTIWNKVFVKGPFGAHDMIEIGYDMKLDKDRK